jgi:calcineurin-like phosphoesterase family protein
MKTWITSDLHFGHTNIMSFCPKTRGHFRNVDHMNSEMIRMWNDSVAQDDLVYILGDVAFTNAQQACAIMNSLAGTKILIQGNHDAKLIKDINFQKCFAEVHNYLRIVYNKTNLLIMFHYPIWEWDQMHRGSIHFHGHLHGNDNGMPGSRALDVSYDATGQVVSDIDIMIARALKGSIRPHHNKIEA